MFPSSLRVGDKVLVGGSRGIWRSVLAVQVSGPIAFITLADDVLTVEVNKVIRALRR
jgi:hypothetical protein